MNLAPMNGQPSEYLEALFELVRKVESENLKLRERVSELEGDLRLADTFRQYACNSEFCNHGAAVLGAK